MKKNLILMSFLTLSIFTFGQAQESVDTQLRKETAKIAAAKIY